MIDIEKLTRWTFDNGMTAEVSKDGQWIAYKDLEVLVARRHSDGAAVTVEKDAARYRMLIEGEPIERTDEFLSSECTSWECDPTGIFVGCFYGTRLFKPARRKVAAIEAHNKAGKEQG